MSGTKVKNKVIFKTKEFFLTYSLWLIGILLNAIPPLFKVANEWLKTDVCNLKYFDFWKLFISNCEFMYVFCSVGFILMIELFFLKNRIKWRFVHNTIFWVTLLYSIILLTLYTISIFSPYWSTHITPEQTANINFISFLILFVVGTLYFVLAHTNRTRKLVNEEEQK